MTVHSLCVDEFTCEANLLTEKIGDDEIGAKKLGFECLWYQALIRGPAENGSLEAGNWWAVQYHITTARPAGMRERSGYCKSEGESCCRRSHSTDAVTISQDSQHGMELEEAIIQPHSPSDLLATFYIN